MRSSFLWAAWLAVAPACRAPAGAPEQPWFAAALEAGRWLEHAAVPTAAGLGWSAVPAESTTPERSLYSGSPGVVLFFLELLASTGDECWAQLARAGADELLAGLPGAEQRVGDEEAGLYTGLAGVGFALGEAWRATGEPRYRAGLERCVETLSRSAFAFVEGVPGLCWSRTNDVIAGTAGIGYFLAWAANVLGSDRARELAAAAATNLASLGQPVEHGLDWPMDPDFPRRMPNFSHGTAGVAAFLARAGRTEPALAGAEHLIALTERSDGFRVTTTRRTGPISTTTAGATGRAGRPGCSASWRARRGRSAGASSRRTARAR